MVGVHAIHNGKVILAKDAVVPVSLREVQFGFSTYEALRVVKGHVVHLDDHLVRLENSCRGIKLTHPFTNQQISGWVHDLILVDAIDEASLRIQLYGGKDPQLFVLASALLTYPDTHYTQGVAAITFEGERLYPSCKTGNLLLNYIALEEARSQGCFEALLVDRHQRVLEGTRSNFFVFKGLDIHTAADEQVLLGITRDRVLKAARLLGYRIVFQAPALQDIRAGIYDEAFISSTSMAAMPLSRIDKLGFPGPFEKTLAIMHLVRSWELDD
ncbi:MAG: aminotransferase class IV [Sphaerochaeta sp.]|jgi:D-alanine transaminase/branched-chain amino acid aminotransferase|nr:aminotransferase class IV [Sphaerochaeta sp.]